MDIYTDEEVEAWKKISEHERFVLLARSQGVEVEDLIMFLKHDAIDPMDILTRLNS